MIQVTDTKLDTTEFATQFANLPYKCTRVDVPPTNNNPDVELAGTYWTHQLHNFCPKEDPTYFQNAGLDASNDALWEDILTYLEAVVPNIPPRDECYSSYINVLRFGNSPGIHCDAPYFVPKNKTLLVYLNPVWDPEWGGETVFYDDELDAKCIVQPKPGRCVLFDGRIPHTAKAPGLKFLYNRFILAFKYMDKNDRNQLFDEYEMQKKPPVFDRGIAGFDPKTVKEIWSNIDIRR